MWKDCAESKKKKNKDLFGSVYSEKDTSQIFTYIIGARFEPPGFLDSLHPYHEDSLSDHRDGTTGT